MASPQFTRVGPEERQRIVKATKAMLKANPHVTGIEVADRTGRSQTTIRKLLAEEGVTLDPRQREGGGRRGQHFAPPKPAEYGFVKCRAYRECHMKKLKALAGENLDLPGGRRAP